MTTQALPETPARRVVDLFGGYDAVREVVGLKTSIQVRRWEYPKDKGGHDGDVPSRHHAALLAAAHERGLPLSSRDLMPWLPAGAAA